MKSLRLGIIGAGKMAAWHLKAYKKIPNVEISAIANPLSRNGKILSRKYHAKHFVDGFDLIENAKIDAVDICVPTGLHKDFIIKALNRGLDVYTEKPLASSIEEIEEIIEVNKNANRIIFNGFNYRFLPEFCKIRSIVNSKILGDIGYIRMFRTTKDNPNSYMFGAYSCGLFNEFHSHFVDLLFGFGFVSPQKIFASGLAVHNWKIPLDTATMTLFYPKNMIAEITTSIASPGLSPSVLIIGTKGTLRLNYGGVSVTPKKEIWSLQDLAILTFREAFTNPFRIFKNPFKWSCRHFINCVAYRERSECDEYSAWKTFKITDSATKSYLENRIVSIDLTK